MHEYAQMPTTSGKSILIVDDEAQVREMFALRLRKEGYAVSQIEDGELGLSEALAMKPALIVLDVNMPHMNGFEMLKRVRASGQWGASVPVIFFTNITPDDVSDLSTISSTAPAYYLVKSKTTPDELVAKVNDVLGHQYSSEARAILPSMAGAAHKILVVEDEEPIRRALVDTLKADDMEVFEAGDGESAMKAALDKQPDLILLDNRLPAQSGFSMLRQLRKSGSFGASVPVIFLSNVRVSSEEEQDAIAAVGAVDYLMKSDTSMKDVVAKIRSILD